MAAENFDRSLAKVLIHEGGYVNHPADPGGETNKGVTRRVYDAYRQRKNLPIQSVRYISNAEVAEIYRFQYWNNCLGDHLPKGVDYVVFDGAVNSGPKQSIIWLQQALGLPQADGSIGNATLQAVENAEPRALIADICARRMGFLQRLRTWGTFGVGWTRRVSGVKATGLAMVNETPAPRMVADVGEPESKNAAKPDKIDKPEITEVAGPATMTSAPFIETANQLLSFGSMSKWITGLVVSLFIIGLGITVFAWWKNRKARQAVSGEATAEVPDFEGLPT